MITIEKKYDLNLAEAIKIASFFRDNTSSLDYENLYYFLSKFDSKNFFTYRRLFDKMVEEILLDNTKEVKEKFDDLETKYFFERENGVKKLSLNIDSNFESFNKELLKFVAKAVVEALISNAKNIKIKVSLDTIESYYGFKDSNKELFQQDFLCWSIINLNTENIKVKTALNHEIILRIEI